MECDADARAYDARPGGSRHPLSQGTPGASTHQPRPGYTQIHSRASPAARLAAEAGAGAAPCLARTPHLARSPLLGRLRGVPSGQGTGTQWPHTCTFKLQDRKDDRGVRLGAQCLSHPWVPLPSSTAPVAAQR